MLAADGYWAVTMIREYNAGTLRTWQPGVVVVAMRGAGAGPFLRATVTTQCRHGELAYKLVLEKNRACCDGGSLRQTLFDLADVEGLAAGVRGLVIRLLDRDGSVLASVAISGRQLRFPVDEQGQARRGEAEGVVPCAMRDYARVAGVSVGL